MRYIKKLGIFNNKNLKEKTLGKKNTGGRNNLGRLTSYRKGGGHKQLYREINFHWNWWQFDGSRQHFSDAETATQFVWT